MLEDFKIIFIRLRTNYRCKLVNVYRINSLNLWQKRLKATADFALRKAQQEKPGILARRASFSLIVNPES